MSPARLPRLTPPRRAAARPGPSPASCSADARGSSEFTCGGERRAWGRLAPSSPPRQEQCPASRDRRLDQRPVQLTPPRNRLLGVLQPRFPGRKKRHCQRCCDLRHLASDGGAAGTRFLGCGRRRPCFLIGSCGQFMCEYVSYAHIGVECVM